MEYRLGDRSAIGPLAHLSQPLTNVLSQVTPIIKDKDSNSARCLVVSVRLGANPLLQILILMFDLGGIGLNPGTRVVMSEDIFDRCTFLCSGY